MLLHLQIILPPPKSGPEDIINQVQVPCDV